MKLILKLDKYDSLYIAIVLFITTFKCAILPPESLGDSFKLALCLQTLFFFCCRNDSFLTFKNCCSEKKGEKDHEIK